MKINIIYLRVSTSIQVANGHSLDNQLQRLQQYCTTNNLENITVLKDEGLSGSDIKRPAFQQLLELVKSSQVDNVIVNALSRFCRNTKDTITTLETLDKYEVRFHSLNEKIDTSTALGRFFITIISALNQMENEQLSERISSVLQHRKSNGFCSGAVPFGFTKTANKKLIPNKQELFTIKIIRELSSQKLTLQEICNALTKKGRLNKRGKVSWYPHQVYRLQRNYSNQKLNSDRISKVD